MQLPLTETRDAALTQVEQAANIAWKADVYRAISVLAFRDIPFTADDITGLIGPATRTHEYRAMGGLLAQAKREGIIRVIGYCRSQRPGNHGGPRSVWVGVGE